MTTDTGILDNLTVGLFDGGEEALAGYLGLREGATAYDGVRFDSFGTNRPDAITVDDVLATTLLSIRIGRSPGREDGFTAGHVEALRERHADIAGLLRELGPDRDLHTLTEEEAVQLLAWEDGAPAYELYMLVRRGLGDGPGTNPGRVATWKLLARKRPALLAIRDNVVAEQRLSYRGDPWFLPWWRTLAARPQVVERLQELQQTLPAEDRPPLLRIADIVLWCGEGCR